MTAAFRRVSRQPHRSPARTSMPQRLRPAVTDPVILMFSRRQVETCDIDEPLQFLRRLTADRQTALEFCGRISLVVDGYNDDPRELFEVPEVRAYIKRLDQAWPNWFFFLSQADESIKLLESCLCETIEVVPGVTSVDMDQLEQSLARHFGAMTALWEALDVPEETCEEVAEGRLNEWDRSSDPRTLVMTNEGRTRTAAEVDNKVLHISHHLTNIGHVVTQAGGGARATTSSATHR
jgi:hypothetical protein